MVQKAQMIARNRGSNQSGMRAHNERLVLSLVRQYGALPKSDIARITGLSAQTVSVIMRGLEAEGFLKREEPVRGKVGQPSVPMSLNATGAYFYGLKVGRRSSEMVLIDFCGQVIDIVNEQYPFPTPERVISFARKAVEQLSAKLDQNELERLAGIGVATPFGMWKWAQFIGAPAVEMERWRDFDLGGELAEICGCEVYIQNDATAACGAELVFGKDAPKDFLYIYIGFFVGGGLVLNGSLFVGCSGTSGSLGPMPIPDSNGGSRPLLEIASIATLERWVIEQGGDGMALWATPLVWDVDQIILDKWVLDVGDALAHSVVASASVIDLEACLIDGWLPEQVRKDVVAATKAALRKINTTGLTVPSVQSGTVGADARSLGAASIPLSTRFLVDQNAFLKDF